jgi:hypothetical protein
MLIGHPRPPPARREPRRVREERRLTTRLSMPAILGAIATLLACAIIETTIRSLPPSQSLAHTMPATEDK